MGTRALDIFVYLKILGYPWVKQGSSKLFLIKLYKYERAGFIADLSKKKELC